MELGPADHPRFNTAIFELQVQKLIRYSPEGQFHFASTSKYTGLEWSQSQLRMAFSHRAGILHIDCRRCELCQHRTRMRAHHLRSYSPLTVSCRIFSLESESDPE